MGWPYSILMGIVYYIYVCMCVLSFLNLLDGSFLKSSLNTARRNPICGRSCARARDANRGNSHLLLHQLPRRFGEPWSSHHGGHSFCCVTVGLFDQCRPCHTTYTRQCRWGFETCSYLVQLWQNAHWHPALVRLWSTCNLCNCHVVCMVLCLLCWNQEQLISKPTAYFPHLHRFSLRTETVVWLHLWTNLFFQDHFDIF